MNEWVVKCGHCEFCPDPVWMQYVKYQVLRFTSYTCWPANWDAHVIIWDLRGNFREYLLFGGIINRTMKWIQKSIIVFTIIIRDSRVLTISCISIIKSLLNSFKAVVCTTISSFPSSNCGKIESIKPIILRTVIGSGMNVTTGRSVRESQKGLQVSTMAKKNVLLKMTSPVTMSWWEEGMKSKCPFCVSGKLTKMHQMLCCMPLWLSAVLPSTLIDHFLAT